MGQLVAFKAGCSLQAFSGCQRGAVDSLKFSYHDLGTLTKVWIEHDGRGSEPHWHLKEVRVSWPGLAQPVTFPCNRWLSHQHGDMTTGRYLYPGEGADMVPPANGSLLLSTQVQLLPSA